MKKYLQKSALAFLLLVVINVIAFFVLTAFNPVIKKVRESSNFKNKQYELLVFGNSMALDGFDCDYLSQKGIDSYNFATGGSHMSSSLTQLKEYLKFNQKPKIIIIGLPSATGQSLLNKVPYANPLIDFYYKPNLQNCVLNPPPVNLRWLYVESLKILVSKAHRDSKIVRGQWKSPKVIADDSTFKNKKTVFQYDNADFQEFIKICKNNAIQVIPIELPGSNENRNSFPYTYPIDLVDHTQLKLYNINNYDISKNIIDSKTDWLAHDHLNQTGSKKLTAFVYEHILKTAIKNQSDD